MSCLNPQNEVGYLRGECPYSFSTLALTKHSEHPLQLDWYGGTLTLTGSPAYAHTLAWLFADIQL